MSKPASLALLWQPERLTDFKVHFARWNGEEHPLDVYLKDFSNWRGWQEYRPKRDDFNRPKIFSLMQLYNETGQWLFGGIWDVIGRLADSYAVELSDELAPLIGRLVVGSSYRDRATRCKLENYFNDFSLTEILRTPFEGRTFLGLSEISLPFHELESIVLRNRADWRGPLSSINGVYVLTDAETGGLYVGSA